jgi:hypothetical protein
MRILPALFALPLLAQAAQPSIYPGRSYRQAVPVPALGEAYTPHPDLVAYAERLAAAAPDRVRRFLYHTTEEGRPQVFLAISSPENLAKLDTLKADNARLANPGSLSGAQARELLGSQPVFVWLGYSIHGSEPAGTEAALAVAYHFAACQDPEVLAQLGRTVLLMDLTQNPDGRARHLQSVAEALQGENPPDPQDAQNQARWPGGRFNHRLFDLNRDWAWQTQAETRAKVALYLAWNPQVLADHHEMQPERNYFFPPNMEPRHQALPGASGNTWLGAFGNALAGAFDRQGFAFFTGEQFDLFYPSYGDSWASFQGAVGMTFECPNPGGLSYLRRDGELLRLSGRLQRHFTASLAAVGLAADKRRELLEDFYQVRLERHRQGDQAGAFLLGEGADPGRTLALVRLLQRNGLEVLRTTAPVNTAALTPIAVAGTPYQVPAGSYLVPLDQPRAPLAVALLEKDAHMGPKPSYDATAWSLPLTYNVPAWFAKVRPKVATAAVAAVPLPAVARARFAYLLPAGTEGRERLLEALLKEGFKGSAAALAFTAKDRTFQAGTAIFPRHRNDGERLDTRIQELAAALGGEVVAVDSSRMDLGPDLGSERAQPLRTPRVAVLMDAPSSPTAVGAVMHTLLENGIPFTQLRAQRLERSDLKNYTHVILADDDGRGKGYQALLGTGGAAKLKAYAQEGGVVIAMQGGAVFASRGGVSEAGYSFLSRKDEEARLKEKDPKRESPVFDPAERTVPWSAREDRELQETLPGVLLHAKVDASHPLAWGLNATDAAILDTSDVMLELSAAGENPIHYPKGELRLAGLLPKALEARLQNTAYLVRERRGKGAVILFAGDPVYRGDAPFTTRAFLNAIFFGAYEN